MFFIIVDFTILIKKNICPSVNDNLTENFDTSIDHFLI